MTETSLPLASPQLPSLASVKENNLQGEKIVRLQFQKLLRGYLAGDASTVVSVLAPSVVIQGRATPSDPAALQAFLDSHPAVAGTPDELFLLDSLDVASAGQSVVLTVKANPDAPADLSQSVPFWKDQQVYTFDRVADTWKLVKVEGS